MGRTDARLRYRFRGGSCAACSASGDSSYVVCYTVNPNVRGREKTESTLLKGLDGCPQKQPSLNGSGFFFVDLEA